MQQTYQDRLELNRVQTHWMNQFADLYSGLQRDLYARIAKGESPAQIKPEFCAVNEISSRQFNAISIELSGKIASTVELLKLNKHEIEANIKKATAAIATAAKAIKSKNKSLEKEIKANIKVPSTESLRIIAKLKKDIIRQRKIKYGKTIRLNSQKNKLTDVVARLNANVPGICFGTRKLFNQQFHLEATEFMKNGQDHNTAFENWLNAWRESRSHQFFLIGSKDETAGNQSCKAVVIH